MGVSKKSSKLSWPKTLVKKWFNSKDNKAEDFLVDDVCYEGSDEYWRETYTLNKSNSERSTRRNSDGVYRSKIELDAPQVTDVQNYRIFVATWNVAGKSPPSHLNLEEWLHKSPPADIYVLGFQEVVPLNAGNVLGTEDNVPARKWVSLIRRTLNNLPVASGDYHNPSMELDSDFEESTMQASDVFHRPSFHSLNRSMRVYNDISEPQPQLDRRFSVCDRVMTEYRVDDSDCESPNVTHYNGLNTSEESDSQKGQSRYNLVASKQMVGIFLTVWIRSDLSDSVRDMKISCVGRGFKGYLGNKGSISISMFLGQTSFCFVCSHLTSGQKGGDELRRNSDVMEILKKTRFPRVHAMGDKYFPQTILSHDRVIWLGDLNYRIALSFRCAKALVEMRNWKALLEKDQLRIEQRQGRVFEGWREGKICFPPTYKYSKNSDMYTGADTLKKQKRRTPAWCDRILWHGKGLQQLSYVRGESRFSDHRPVYGVFLAEVESCHRGNFRKSMSYSSARVEVEELLPCSHEYTGFNLYQKCSIFL